MPTIRRVRKVANPRSRATRSRRKLSAKQIRYFGTRRQKAALKAARSRKRTTAAKGSSRSHRSPNPALVLTLGAVNPRKKRSSTMARTRKRRASTAGRRVTRKRANPRTVARRRRRTSNPRYLSAPRRRRRVTRHRRRSNPKLFGTNLSGTQMAQAILGGLIGVAAAKFIPGMVPGGLLGGVANNNIMRTVITGAAAWLAGMAATKFAGETFGNAVLFGGLMQTGSVGLNAFLPSAGRMLALEGMGELVDTAGFVVPQNPVLPLPMPVQARVGVNGLDRSFGRAF